MWLATWHRAANSLLKNAIVTFFNPSQVQSKLHDSQIVAFSCHAVVRLAGTTELMVLQLVASQPRQPVLDSS